MRATRKYSDSLIALDPEEGAMSRINLRMPERLKARVEAAAAGEGLSVNAWLVRASADELKGAGARKPLEAVFPPEKYAWITPLDRLEPRTVYWYLCGLAIFLLGGSGAFLSTP